MSNVKAMDPNAMNDWVPKVDRELPKEEQFTIHYHPLDMHKEAILTDNQVSNIQKGRKSQYTYMISQTDCKRLEKTIVGWDNFTYPETHEKAGQKVPFSVDNIGLLPPEIRSEFTEHITGRKRAEEADDDSGELKA